MDKGTFLQRFAVTSVLVLIIGFFVSQVKITEQPIKPVPKETQIAEKPKETVKPTPQQTVKIQPTKKPEKIRKHGLYGLTLDEIKRKVSQYGYKKLEYKWRTPVGVYRFSRRGDYHIKVILNEQGICKYVEIIIVSDYYSPSDLRQLEKFVGN